MTIRVDGIALRCLVEGAGDPLVLIHGVGASLEVWDGVAARLRDHYRVVRYDQRGHGQSDKASGPYTVEVFSNDLRALLDALAIERVHVAGHSLGGLVAQSFALDYPARLLKLALISTVAGRTEEERRRVEERLAMVATGIADDHFRASLDRWFTDEFRAANPKLLEAYAARNQANDPACYAAAYRVLAETDLAARLHEITADPAQRRQCLADVVPVAAEGTDDIREDRLVIRARYAVFRAGGHHEARRAVAGDAIQFGSGSSTALIALPMVRPRTTQRNG